MATAPDISALSGDDLLRAAERLSLSELRRFASDVLALQIRRSGQGPPNLEVVLLTRIRQPLPGPLQKRLGELIDRRDARLLTTAEHAELLTLSDEAERREVDRMEAIATLAAVKGVSLASLMDDLGLGSPDS